MEKWKKEREKEKILVWEKERKKENDDDEDEARQNPQKDAGKRRESKKRDVLFTKLMGVCHHPVLVVSLVYHLRRGGNCPRMSIECPVRDRAATLSR